MTVENKTRVNHGVVEAPQAPTETPLNPPSGIPLSPTSRGPISLGKFSVPPSARFGSPIARPPISEPIATSVGTRSLDQHLVHAVEHFEGPADPRFQAALGIAYNRVMAE